MPCCMQKDSGPLQTADGTESGTFCCAGILLVLPGNKQPSSVSLKWDEVSKDLQRVEYIRSFQDFTSHWHKGHSRCDGGDLHKCRVV
jgi:hypothetical protein